MDAIHTSQWFSCSQFHQHFTRAFFVQNFGGKNALLYKKRGRKILMKLTPTVNFTNILRPAEGKLTHGVNLINTLVQNANITNQFHQ